MDLLERIERLFSSALVEDIIRREHSWNFYFSIGEVSVEHVWRLVEHGKLIVTDREDGHTYGEPIAIDAEARARKLLLKRRTLGALIDPETADLKISLEGGVRLEILTIAPRTAAWEFDDGKNVIVARGGQLSNPGWMFKDAPRA
jgi:hypothetical protein